MDFKYTDERFADIQMLRYQLPGFDELTTKQKAYIYCLSQATLWGRDITFDQFGKTNLLIRKTLEAIYEEKFMQTDAADTIIDAEDKAIVTYLKRIWFSNGIYHHYGSEKFTPDFSQQYFEKLVNELPAD